MQQLTFSLVHFFSFTLLSPPPPPGCPQEGEGGGGCLPGGPAARLSRHRGDRRHSSQRSGRQVQAHAGGVGRRGGSGGEGGGRSGG